MINQNSQFYEALNIHPNILGRVLYKQIFSGFHEPLEKSVKQSHSECRSDYQSVRQSRTSHKYQEHRKTRNSDTFCSDSNVYTNEINPLRYLNYFFQRSYVLLSFVVFLKWLATVLCMKRSV